MKSYHTSKIYNIGITIPYFYIIQHKHTKIMYAGCRYAEFCNPEEFMKPNEYQTHSKIIQEIIKNEGLDVFEILRIDTNLDGCSAYEYEKAFILIHNCRKSPEWYNWKIIEDKSNNLTIDESRKSIAKPLPSLEYLNECFEYDELSGHLTWKIRPEHHFSRRIAWKKSNSEFAGKIAGCFDKKSGYIMVIINAKKYQAHRIIMKIMTGNDPENVVDHKNGIKHDNRWSNLRQSTIMQNTKNKAKQWNNTSGYVGVYFSKHDNLWNAYITHDKVRYNLGTFNNIEDAIKVRKDAELKYHKEFSAQHRQ